MTDAAAQQTRFTISQLRNKNIWRELELISVLVMIIFVSSLLPSLLLRYVYTDPQMMETPAIFEVIPVFSFVLGVAMFIYVVVSNLMREMKAMQLERSLETGSVATPMVTTNSSDLQTAMRNLSVKADTKRRTKVVAAQRVTAKNTKVARSSKKRSK